MTDDPRPRVEASDVTVRDLVIDELTAGWRGVLALGYSGAHLVPAGDPNADRTLCDKPTYVPHRAPSWQHDKPCPGCATAAGHEAHRRVVGRLTAKAMEQLDAEAQAATEAADKKDTRR